MNFYWNDSRLIFPWMNSSVSYFALPGSFEDKIWTPDIYIPESSTSERLGMLEENRLIWLRRDGTVLYNTKFNVVIGCQMDFQYYPLDQQKCLFHIESCKYFLKKLFVFKCGIFATIY